MKPIAKPGDYLISYFDELDDEMWQELVDDDGLFRCREVANQKIKAIPTLKSYRICKVVDNSKYNTWSVTK